MAYTVLSDVTAYSVSDALASTTLFTLLSPVDATEYAKYQLLGQLSRYNQVASAFAQQRVRAAYALQQGSAERAADDWFDVRTETEDAVRFFADLVGRVRSIRELANDMITTSVKAEYGDSFSATGYEATFNSKLRSWLTEAEDRGGNPNLIGSATQRNYEYLIDVSGERRYVGRYDLTTDYAITDTGGYVWRKDSEYGRLLTRYDATTGESTGIYADVSGGVRLDSLIDDTVVFTVLPDTADEQQFTGTLSRDGLGVLDAWLYEGLATDTGRAAAQDDLHGAISTIDAQLARFSAELAMAEFYKEAAATNVTNLRNTLDSITLAMAQELQQVDDRFQLLGNTNILVADQAITVRDEYIRAFGLGSNSTLIQSLIDVLA